ncbi:hypothetical protein NQZ79_g1199 [Umbelopsis isabellina]|nr:hypothetical protein NQZ79_g1199 [Umbelopsis isabellina]
MTKRKAALCFTGGKDCTLALHRTIESGQYDIPLLVTFAPANMQKFKAHPLSVVQMQTQSLGIPHRVYLVEGPDFLGSYQKHISGIKEEYGIDALVTGKPTFHEDLDIKSLISTLFQGDILDVCHNFMPRAVEGTGVELIRPLWELPRSEILEDIWKHGFEVLISCLNVTKFDTDLDVETFVGKKLSKELLQKVRDHNEKFGRDVDLAGEFGEFHTMVLDAPLFKTKIDVSGGQIVRDGDFAYWSFSNVA